MFLRRSKPEPLAQPMGLVSFGLPVLGLLGWIKMAAIALLIAAPAYKAGHWMGDRVGYKRHTEEVSREMKAANDRIASLNEALDEARWVLESGRDNQASIVTQSLKDFSPVVRQECAAKCSIPQDTSEALEAIQ